MLSTNGTIPSQSAFPKLLCACGKTTDEVESILNAAVGHPDEATVEELARISHGRPLNTHQFRGYVIVPSSSAAQPKIVVDKCPAQSKRSLWFAYGGADTHWQGMCRQMMALDVFEKSIRRCSDSLLQTSDGLDLYAEIMNGLPNVSRNPVIPRVATTAAQVALTDLLRHLGLEPDGFLGVSTGEFSCAYADGCLTLDETLQCAYWRGECVRGKHFPPFDAALIGLSCDEVAKRCPAGVVPTVDVCYDRTFVAGPPDAVERFLQDLTAEGVWVRDEHPKGVPPHSYFVEPIAEELHSKTKKVILSPKARSKRWISTSVSDKEATSTNADGLASADYMVKNFISPVLLTQALRKIPDGAVVVELAAHCKLQPVLIKVLSSSSTCVGLLKANEEHELEFFFDKLGKIYNAGVDVHFERLRCSNGERPSQS